MIEKMKKLKPLNLLSLPIKEVAVVTVLYLAYLFTQLGAMLAIGSSDLGFAFSVMITAFCYIGATIIFRNHVEILLIPQLFSVLTSLTAFRQFQYYNLLTWLSIATTSAFCVVFIASLYKKLSPKVAKITVSTHLAVSLVCAVVNLVKQLNYSNGYELGTLLSFFSSVFLLSATFATFFFAKHEESRKALASKKEAKSVLIIIIVVIVIVIFGSGVFSNETTSYYRDLNGNGKEDFGEGVWYEDKNGTHFYR